MITREPGFIYLLFMEIISCLFNVFAPMLFISYFHKKKLEINFTFYKYSGVLILINIAFLFLCYFRNGFLIRNEIIPIIISYVLTLLVLIFYSVERGKEGNAFEKVLPAFTYMAIVLIAGMIGSLIIAVERYGYSAFCPPVSTAVFDRFIYLTIRIICILLLAIIFLKPLKIKDSFKQKNNLLIFLLPLPILSVFTVMLIFPNSYSNYENHYIFEACLFFSAIILNAFSCFSTYYLVNETQKKNQIEKEKELYQNMLDLESKRYEDIKQSSEQIHKIRHDIKNMLFSVKADLDKENVEEANQKLDSMLESIGNVGTIINTENRTIDYIVNAKLSSLDQTVISVTGDITGLNNIDDVDLAIILGNVLDNAIEAIQDIDEPYIELSFFTKDNYQNILCKNAIKESVLEENPDLDTIKPSQVEHGLGLKSVKELANKYGGSVCIFEENNLFCVQILLPIE